MNYYFAYHSWKNQDGFDYKRGYGFKEEGKLSKINIGDFIYVIQSLKLKGKLKFQLCGKYKVIEKYTDYDFQDREYRIRLSDISKLSPFLNIDETEWSNRLPTSPRNDPWTNFKKHFCAQGVTLQAALSADIVSVFEHNLPDTKESNGTSPPISQGELIDDLKDIENSDLSKSEKEVLTKARIGQGKFRRDVINTWQGEKCAITLVSIKEMLIASHIKAWKDCGTTDERLDGANGILLCAHVDKLFDNHLITFNSKNSRYYLELSQSLDNAQLNGLGIEKGIELDVSHLDFKASERFETYMEHHNLVFADKESSRV
ncbi:HNH endonuclease [Moritella viscosa]|uniref:HNH endonuclease n=1 Tax=Moritella viscosa TaxID=80854 RepID=UPI000911064F|nr:HNH endonuclease signature motif containing protein [Moritella viscosa]SGY81498.1 Putative uncharacterized protein [Moritella viscosa]